MFVGKLGTFVALGVRGSGMIDNCSFNLGEFYVKMGKTNRNFWRYMEMNKEQLYAAQTAMIEWLSDPHELGKKPFKIECAGEFDFNEMHYYIFKFKASLLGNLEVLSFIMKKQDNFVKEVVSFLKKLLVSRKQKMSLQN